MKNKETEKWVCDFCGSNQDKVAKMITSPNGETAICNDCIAKCAGIILDAIKTSSFVQPMKQSESGEPLTKEGGAA